MTMLIATELYDVAAVGGYAPEFNVEAGPVEFDAEDDDAGGADDVRGDKAFDFVAEAGAVDLARWPAGWRKPSQAVLAAVAAASVKYEVPEDIILAVIRKESSDFNPRARGVVLKGSYARNKDLPIPRGGGITWGQKFRESDWGAWGIMQVVPFNLYGDGRLIKVSEPLTAMFDVKRNVMGGARVLKILFDKYGTWEDAVYRYNGSKKYQREVFAFLAELRAAQVA